MLLNAKSGIGRFSSTMARRTRTPPKKEVLGFWSNCGQSFEVEGENWRPQRDLNSRRRRERPVSWARLDDGDVRYPLSEKRSEPRRDRTFDHLIKSQVLYQLS